MEYARLHRGRAFPGIEPATKKVRPRQGGNSNETTLATRHEPGGAQQRKQHEQIFVNRYKREDRKRP